MSLKSRLQQLDNFVRFWENLVKEFPESESYKRALAVAIQERVDLANNTGKKKCRSTTKK